MKLHEISSPADRRLLQGTFRNFVGYLTAGYPDRESFFRIAKECEKAGLGIFEIGFPAEDPYADGEVIRRAHSVVDRAIVTDLSFWRRLRETVSAPIWLMGYGKDLVDSGMYLTLAREGLIDGLVLPDLDNGRRFEIRKEAAPFSVDVLGFLCPSASEKENLFCLHNFGIIYHQLYSGLTGIVNNSEDYLELLALARRESNAYLFAGFGIGTPERARELLDHGFDGVVIGTAIMKRLAESEAELYAFVKELASTVRAAGGRKDHEVHGGI